jgi:hypothetical protein
MIEKLLYERFKGCSADHVVRRYDEGLAKITLLCEAANLDYHDRLAELDEQLQAVIAEKRFAEEARKYREQKQIEALQVHIPEVKPIVETDKIENNPPQSKKAVEAYKDGNHLEKSFYRAPELTMEEKLRAQNQGFEYVRLNELDGHVTGGFYIKRPKNETAYHFSMKHLFAELHDKLQLEYHVAGKYVDLAFITGNFSLGIEIETGLNKLEDVSCKIPWLNEHFTQWVFVVRKDFLPRYSQFVDNKKSFCFTPKQAMEYVLKMCACHQTPLI